MSVPLFINGLEVTSNETITYSHAVAGVVGSVSVCTAELLEQAITTSKAAFRGWADTPAAQRRDIINKFGDLMVAKQDFFAKIYEKETPVEHMVTFTDFQYTLGHIREAASICTQIKGDIPTTLDNSLALVLREPYGVVLSLTPYNFALTLTLRAILYPLACGNTVLLKTSERLPLLCTELAKTFKEAGLPVLSFRAVVGKIVAQLCGKYSKPILLELGGKAPVIVCESADFATAANNILFAANAHSGQICMSTEVAICVGPVAKAKLQAEVQAIVESEAWTSLGDFEVVSPDASQKMRGLWKDAIDLGAKVLTKATLAAPGHPAAIPATVLADVTPNMRIYAEETFGPSFNIVEVKDIDAAVAMANSSGYGLSAAVWSSDYYQAMEIAKLLESGAVHINSSTVHDEAGLPHGGHKGSGFGRFNGTYAIDSFTQTKSVTMRKPSPLPLSILRGRLF
ncbi:hypothetical protein RQP46_004487 [Phenoliferia psychrophenolica]